MKRDRHSVDIHVGKRIRHRRWSTGMTQQQLAARVGIKFQQIQKYETGINRVSASRLWEISVVLNVPVSYFFDKMDADTGTQSTPVCKRSFDAWDRKETFQMIRAFRSMPASQRRPLFDLARVLSESSAV